MDIERIRRDAKAKREKLGWSQEHLGKLLQVTQQSIAQFEKGEVHRPRYIRELIDVLRLNEGVDADNVVPCDRHASGEDRSRLGNLEPSTLSDVAGEVHLVKPGKSDLPIYGSTTGGVSGMLVSRQPIEFIERPEQLKTVAGAFSVYAVNDSMSPMCRTGDLLLVHPTKPIRPGDDVLIIKKANVNSWHEALVRELVDWTDEAVTVKRYQPTESECTIPRGDVLFMHLIIGVMRG